MVANDEKPALTGKKNTIKVLAKPYTLCTNLQPFTLSYGEYHLERRFLNGA